MGSPDTLDLVSVVLDECHIDPTLLSTSDQLILMEAIAVIVKPQLRYLAGGKPLEEFIDGLVYPRVRRSTSPVVITWPSGIDSRTVCFALNEQRKYEGEHQEYGGYPYLKEQTLFLSRDGQWLLHEARYRTSYGHRADTEQAESSHFQLLNRDGLRALLAKQPSCLMSSLGALCRIARQSVTDRQERLGVLRKLEHRLLGMQQRLR